MPNRDLYQNVLYHFIWTWITYERLSFFMEFDVFTCWDSLNLNRFTNFQRGSRGNSSCLSRLLFPPSTHWIYFIQLYQIPISILVYFYPKGEIMIFFFQFNLTFYETFNYTKYPLVYWYIFTPKARLWFSFFNLILHFMKHPPHFNLKVIFVSCSVFRDCGMCFSNT